MKKVLLTLLVVCGVATFIEARPHHPPPQPRHVRHHKPPRPPRVGWGLNISPWGSSFSIGTRVGRHGSISYTMPLAPAPKPLPPPPPQRETIIIQQPIIVQPPATPAVEQKSTKTRKWVEGYWMEKRDGNGMLISRTWIDGHWEE